MNISDGAKLIEWAILMATIIGVVATISQPFISYWLETRRDKKYDELKRILSKKLEAKEERIKNLEEKQENYEKDQRLELRELVKKFKNLHIKNSKQVIGYRGVGEEWRSWNLDLETKEEKEEHDEVFFEQIEKIISKVNILDDEPSFVGYKSQQNYSRLSESEEHEFIKWREYKEILGKSVNAFSYFTSLSESVGNSRKILFSMNKMDLLCSKILS